MYEHIDYEGEALNVAVGHPQQRLGAWNWAHKASSAKVLDGCHIYACTEHKFQGSCHLIKSSPSFVPDGRNDVFSSARCECATGTPATSSAPVTAWFCVASLTRDSVTGPFADIENAKAELNKVPGSYSSRQMICEMGAEGAKADATVVGGQNQGDGTAAGFEKFWLDRVDIDDMNAMCEASCFI